LPVQAADEGTDKPRVGPISAEAMAKVRELHPGEYFAKTREGCRVITDEPHPSRKEAITAAWARFTWEGVCSEGTALGPGKLIARSENGETVYITEGWQLYGRWIGLSVVTFLYPGASGSKTEVFYWDGEGYGRGVPRSDSSEARKEPHMPSVSYFARDRSKRVYYSIRGSCGANAQPCVSEWKPPYPPVADPSAGFTYFPCNGSCVNLWVEKAAPLIAALDTFAKKHAADVADVKQALEPLLVQRRREAVEAEAQAKRDAAEAEVQAKRKAVEAEAEARRKAAQAELVAQAEAQRKREEAARAEQQLRTSLQTLNPGQLFARADELNAQGDSARAREVQRALIGRFPNHPLAATTARQMVGESSANSTPPDNGGSSRKAANPAASTGTGLRPIWPSDMEPGNIYFVVEIDMEDYPPIMVSALSGQEAVARVQAARAKDRLLRPTTFKLLAGRECIGPAWGAVVTLGGKPWGAACANTPAAAIEGAFTGCRQQDPKGRGCEPEPSIVLALSGSTSWSSDTSAQGLHGRFGSYNAQTWMEQYTKSPINSMQQALSGFDKACSDGRPCYKTSSNTGCIHENTHSEILQKCMDRKLTPGGLSGSIRSRLR